MRNARRLGFLAAASCAASFLAVLACTALAQSPRIEELVSAVVGIKTHINPEGQTVAGLGREREGSGIVIDNDGLVLTIGYLMVEADAAEVVANDGRTVPASVVGYDHESGFGLLRTIEPLKLKPMGLGRSAEVNEHDPVLIASHGGAAMAALATIVSKREFAGSWEYMLDEALFTAPAHPAWSGAALISREGKLVGVGSLIVGDASGDGEKQPGNMFVPIDRLTASLADLLSTGRPATPPHPWLGINAQEIDGRLVVTRVSADGPAQRAGLTRGSIVTAVAGERVRDLAGFYRLLWAQGEAGIEVPLTVEERGASREVTVKTMNRYDYLKLDTTY